MGFGGRLHGLLVRGLSGGEVQRPCSHHHVRSRFGLGDPLEWEDEPDRSIVWSLLSKWTFLC